MSYLKYLKQELTHFSTEYNFTLLSLIVAITGTLVLAAAIEFTEFGTPDLIPLNEVKNNENRIVLVQGVVVEQYYSGRIFYLDDNDDNTNEAPLQVYAPNSNFAPRVGDIVQVIGEVRKYEGELEILSSGSNDVILVKAWESDIISISDLSENPVEYVDKNIRLVNVTIISDSYTSYNTTSFRIGDGNHSLRVEFNSDEFVISDFFQYDIVEVRGKFIYDEYWYSYQLLLEGEYHGAWLTHE